MSSMSKAQRTEGRARNPVAESVDKFAYRKTLAILSSVCRGVVLRISNLIVALPATGAEFQQVMPRDLTAYRSAGDVDLPFKDLCLRLGERLRGRRLRYRAVLDRVFAAVAVAVNDPAADFGHRASLVSTDLAERLVRALAWLRDDIVGVRQNDTAAHRDLRGGHARAFRSLRFRCRRLGGSHLGGRRRGGRLRCRWLGWRR